MRAKNPSNVVSSAIAALHEASRTDAKARAYLNSIEARPSLSESYVTPDNRFRIHYTTIGVHAVDLTSTIVSGIPDYVYEAGQAAQKSYALLVDTLGMRGHVADGGVDGPEYDFYILNLNNVYGETIPEFSGSSGPSYIRIDNDYDDTIFFSKGLAGLRVTVAHEYFHAVQLNYLRSFRNENLFFFETSSTWFEDLAYDNINDYYQYLPRWFENTAFSLTTKDNFHEYGSSIWLHYLTEQLNSNAVVERIWERIQTESAIDAARTVLETAPYNFQFGDLVHEFYTWTYFTGSRANPMLYFEEGAAYPEIPFNSAPLLDPPQVLATDELRPLAANFYSFLQSPIDMYLSLNPENSNQWLFSSLRKENNGNAYSIQTQPALSSIFLEAENDETMLAIVVSKFRIVKSKF